MSLRCSLSAQPKAFALLSVCYCGSKVLLFGWLWNTNSTLSLQIPSGNFISVAAMSRDLNARVITHFWLISGEHSEQLNPQKAPRPGGSSLLCLEAFSLTLLIRLCLIDSCLVISSTKNKKQCISVCTHLEPQLFYQFPFTPFNSCCRSSHISQRPRTIK